MTRQLLESIFRRKGTGYPLAAYARVRMAYEILLSTGNAAAAERVVSRHPAAREVWEEAAQSV